MANITVRKDNNNPQQPTSNLAREIDPFRAVRDIFRWDPFREMAPLFNIEPSLAFAPDFEVKETKDTYLFKADLPGVKESDIEVHTTGNRITISGSRKEETEEKAETYYACERKYGSFTRSYTLPEGADMQHINAELKAGVLTVAVAKLAEVQPKKITVKSASAKA